MASVLNIEEQSVPATITDTDVVELQPNLTEHKVTVRGASDVTVRFKPYGSDSFDDWEDPDKGVIAAGQSAVYIVGPSSEMEVVTVTDGATVDVTVLSW